MQKSVANSTGTRDTAVALIATLIAIYGVSQFARNSIGVLANDLARELDLSATQIGLLSSVFFFSFAAAQIPVGIAIDRYGPKLTMLVSVTICVLGTVLFAFAPSATILIMARMMIGLGCSTFLMAPLAIYARRFPPTQFAMLASLQMGLANIGTLLATAPLAASAAAIGWRFSFLVFAGVTAIIGLLVLKVIPRDRTGEAARESWIDTFRGVGMAVRTPSFWPVFLAHLTGYSSFAAVVGLWAGPWLSDVYGADLALRGRLLLIGAGAQIAGLLLWGASDRYWRSYRRPVLVGIVISAGLLLYAAMVPMSLVGAAIWLGLFGLMIAYTPIVTAHGKALFPPMLTGRGITLMNIGSMGGAFIAQSLTGALVDWVGRVGEGYPPSAYRLVFASLAVGLLITSVVYARAGDPHPSAGPATE